jgi:hypothetical protein
MIKAVEARDIEVLLERVPVIEIFKHHIIIFLKKNP